jgi:hypothetical protein
LRPLRETHSVSFPEHFPTPNSEEPSWCLAVYSGLIEG